MSERFALLGLARSRSRWFSDLTRWSNSALAPIDYLKVLTVDEARALLGSGRKLSALILDASIPHLDRELVAVATSTGAAVLVVDDPAVHRDWDALGVTSILPADFGPAELTEVLNRCARPVDRSAQRTSSIAVSLTPSAELGPLIGVAGTGGVGSSTLSMSLAQALASTSGDSTALVDGARVADMAMYHDVGDVIPGLPELVDAHRSDQPDPDEVRKLLFSIGNRGYHLMLGQRRARDASAMGIHSTEAAIEGLRRSFDIVVVDSDPDLDGEPETGSIDLEEHNTVARTVASTADCMFLVSRPGIKGIHALTRLVDRYTDFGMPRERLVPVINFAPRTNSARSSITRAVSELTSSNDSHCHPVIFTKSYRSLEDVHNRVERMPVALGGSVAKVAERLIASLEPRTSMLAPVPVRGAHLRLGTETRLRGAADGRNSEPRSDVA